MIHNVYMLYDNVSCMYVGSLMIMINDNVAKRSIADFLKQPNFPFAKMYKDLKLYKLATIDVEQGLIESDKSFICDLSDLVEE